MRSSHITLAVAFLLLVLLGIFLWPGARLPALVKASSTTPATQKLAQLNDEPEISLDHASPAKSMTSPATSESDEPGVTAAGSLTRLLFRYDDDSLARLQQEATRLGLRVSDSIPALRLLLLEGDRNFLATLATMFPEQVLEYDVPVFLPDPDLPSTNSGYAGPPFRHGLLDWLGVNQENSERGTGVVVALLDTAVKATGSLTNANLHTLDLFGLATEGDYAGHGYAVASLLAGQSDSLQGVSPGVELLSIPVLGGNGSGSAFQVAQAIVAAVDAGADLISMSLGAYSASFALLEAVEYASSAGVVIVAAVGNDGFERLLYPAAYADVIAVSAINAAAGWADFSNHGDAVSLAAPGVGVYADWEPGQSIYFTGTSAAVPSVTGVIANLLSQDSSLTAREAADIVLASADDAGAPENDPYYGIGILNAARAESWDTPGIYDAAIADHYLESTTSQDNLLPVTVTAQNRGTEILPQMVLTVNLDGKTTTYQFYNVEPGEVVAATVNVDAQKLAGGQSTLLTSTVTTPGVNDSVSGNETKTTMLRLKE